jgi:MFS family permease
MTNAFGILLVFQGVATAVGPPAAGFLFDISQSYQFTFIFSGVMIAVSAVILFLIPYYRYIISKRRKSVEKQENEK